MGVGAPFAQGRRGGLNGCWCRVGLPRHQGLVPWPEGQRTLRGRGPPSQRGAPSGSVGWGGLGPGRPPRWGPPRRTKQRLRARPHHRGPTPRRAPEARACEHARRRRLEMAVGAAQGAGAGSGAVWLGYAPTSPGI